MTPRLVALTHGRNCTGCAEALQLAEQIDDDYRPTRTAKTVTDRTGTEHTAILERGEP